MIATIQPHLDALRVLQGHITIVVINKEESDSRAEQLATSQFDFEKLPDGRTKAVIRDTAEGLRHFIAEKGISVESWVAVYKYDVRYDGASYIGILGGRTVRVQTGMLDNQFGYVAVQSSRFEHIGRVATLMVFRPDGRFDRLFTRQ